jgi:hypothetical protein
MFPQSQDSIVKGHLMLPVAMFPQSQDSIVKGHLMLPVAMFPQSQDSIVKGHLMLPVAFRVRPAYTDSLRVCTNTNTSCSFAHNDVLISPFALFIPFIGARRYFLALCNTVSCIVSHYLFPLEFNTMCLMT